jgi:3-hydroxyacyl-CoA dehydrogenase
VLRARRPFASLALKVLGLVLVGGVAGSMVIGLGVVGSALAWAFVAAIALEVVAFVVSLRASAVHRRRLEAVLEAQRDEVVAMLERARIPQRGSVPGLRDRVTRALTILREKQR